MSAYIINLKTLLPYNINLVDLIQIGIIFIALLSLLKALYNTRAWFLIKTLAILGVFYVSVIIFNMVILEVILEKMFSVLIIAVVIMLQPQLQKIFEVIGSNNAFKRIHMFSKTKEDNRHYSKNSTEEIIQACESLSEAKTGALIVLERQIPLTEYSETGIKVGAKISKEMLINIFEKNTPLHDGAVIIKDNLIESATCYLPLTKNYISKKLGTRHRAAVGISETSDSVVIVVSEETGKISVCYGGKITHDVTRSKLFDLLEKYANKNESKNTRNEESIIKPSFKWLVFIASIIVWATVSYSIDPVTSKIFYSVPVSIKNEDVLKTLDKTYDISKGDVVTVKISGKKSIVNNLNAKQIHANADFSEMSVVYAVPIKVEVESEYNSLLSYEILSDNVMKVQLEDITQLEIPVIVKTIGQVNNDFVLDKPTLSKEYISVSGAKSVVTTLKEAVVVINVDNIDEDTVYEEHFEIYDKNGSVVNNEKIKYEDEIICVQTRLLKTKTVACEVNITNKKYKLVSYEVDEIKVAGSDNVLKNLSKINIELNPEKIDLNKKTVMINLVGYLPHGVVLANDQTEIIEIKFNIEEGRSWQ